MTTPFYNKGGITIYNDDCLEVMPKLGMVFDAVIADPPYFEIVKHDWDKQWDSLTDYIAWLEKVVIQIKAALIAKGSFYIFGDDKTIAYVQVMIDRYLTLLNSLVWNKYNSQPQKNTFNLRSYAPMTERILFYTPQLCPTGLGTLHSTNNGIFVFEPIRSYLENERKRSGVSRKEINLFFSKYTNKKGCLDRSVCEHYFGYSQWCLPTKVIYENVLRVIFNRGDNNGFLRREYEDLRREYEDLRREYEDLRRTFNATSNTFDVITGPIVSQSEASEAASHPTTKPLWLITKLMQVSTNKGDIILDPFMGSGTTLVAAQREGRRAVGIELSEDYCKIAVERLRQPSFFSIPDKPKPTPAKQMAMLDGL